jgi:hypothetical protein
MTRTAARLARLEAIAAPDAPQEVVICRMSVNAAAPWAIIRSTSGTPTPASRAARARLEAEGYTVAEG